MELYLGEIITKLEGVSPLIADPPRRVAERATWYGNGNPEV